MESSNAKLPTPMPASTIEPIASPAPGYSGIEEKSAPLHSFVEHVMTYAFPVLWAIGLYLAIRELSSLGLLWTLMIAMPLAWVLADLVSGIVHWFADTYGTDETPLFGPTLIKPFRQHHAYPKDICTHGLVLAIGNSCTLAVPIQIGFLYFTVTDEEVSGLHAFSLLSFNLFAAATVATNMFHKWAHSDKPNPVVSVLQRFKIVLNSNHHQLHHTTPFDSNYCITNGWLNPVLEKIRFFRSLEWILARTGLEPSEPTYNQRAVLARSSSTR